MSVVPFTGAAGLASIARRTLLVRAAFAAVLVALVLVTAVEARRPHTASAGALPVRSGDMIVLDLSASISQDTYSRNPWSSTFSGGTVISSGLALAKSLLEENRLRHAHVVLVSDLHDDPEDRNRLNEIVTAYRRDGVALRVVPLNAAPDDAAYFGRLTSTALKDVAAPPAAQPTTPPALGPTRSAFPTVIVLLVAAAACALAAS